MADMEDRSVDERNDGVRLPPQRTQYIDDSQLRTHVMQELRRSVFKKGHTLATLTGCDVFIKVIDEASISQFYGTEYFIRQYYEEGIKADVDDLAVSGTTGLPLEAEQQEEALDLSCGKQKQSFEGYLEDDTFDYENGTLRRNGTNFNPIHIEPEPVYGRISASSEPKNQALMNSSPVDENTRTPQTSAFTTHSALGLTGTNRGSPSTQYSIPPVSLQSPTAQFSPQKNSSFDVGSVQGTPLMNGPLDLAGDPQLHIEGSSSVTQLTDQTQPSHIQEIKNYLIPLANLAVTLLRQKAQGQNHQLQVDRDALLAQAQALQISANSATGSNVAEAEELAKQAFAAALDLTAKSQGSDVLPMLGTSHVEAEPPLPQPMTPSSPNKRPSHCETISVKDLLQQHQQPKRMRLGPSLPANLMNNMVYPQTQITSSDQGQGQISPQSPMVGNVQPNMMVQPIIIGHPPGIPREFSTQDFQQPRPVLHNSQNQERSQIRIERAFSLQQAVLAQQQIEQHQQNHTVRELLVQNVRHLHGKEIGSIRPPVPPLIKAEPIDKRKDCSRSLETPANGTNLTDPTAESMRNNDNIANIVANIKTEPIDPTERLSSCNQEIRNPRKSSIGSTERRSSFNEVSSNQRSSSIDDDEDENRLFIDTGENSSVDDDALPSRKNEKSKVVQEDCESKDSNDSNQGRGEILDDPKKRRFRCEICGKVYAKNESLKYHKMNHDNYRPHQCETCGRAFANPYTLDVHRRIHLNESDKPYRCEYCDKTFATSSHRNVHMTHHKEVQSFECTICRRRYLNKETLEAHVQRHGERRYPCDTCGMCFKAMAELSEHRLIHSLPKNFPCEVCGREFHRRNELVLHMSKAHPNTRPFECENCDKTFSTVESLRVHQRCHTGELPHKCRFCSRQFVHGKHCEAHELGHFKDNKSKPLEMMLINNSGAVFYQCEKCGQIFTELSHLQTHQKLHKLQEKEEALATQAGVPLPKSNIVLPHGISQGPPGIPVSSVTQNSIMIPNSVPLMNGPQISNVVSLQNVTPTTTTVLQNPTLIATATLPSSSATMVSSNNNFMLENRNMVTTVAGNVNQVHSIPVGPPRLENNPQSTEASKTLNLTSPSHLPPPLHRQIPVSNRSPTGSALTADKGLTSPTSDAHLINESSKSPSASVRLVPVSSE